MWINVLAHNLPSYQHTKTLVPSSIDQVVTPTTAAQSIYGFLGKFFFIYVSIDNLNLWVFITNYFKKI